MTNKSVISLLAILVIVLGVFGYVVSSNKSFTETKSFEREITRVENVSKSNDIESIEADLNATDLGNLDQELTSIETELN
ncbi:MAG: hypothetical protein ACD_19C00021G0020 [uncultured bacterium]|nr:MAG: hypothetical protein ACD_19C00021G0020 [uncultured bacterium]